MTDNYYPTYIAWKMNLVNGHSNELMVGVDTAYRIKKTAQKLSDASLGYRFLIEDVTSSYLDQFMPLYDSFMAQKEGGTVFDVRNKIAFGQAAGKTYEAISLYENETLLGGLLYSLNDTYLGVAYRVFPHQLKLKLPISCSYVAEQKLIERARELHKETIVHGRDRNKYGVNSSIGLAEYKIRIGCVPYISASPENEFHLLADLKPTKDTLVFLGNRAGEEIKDGVLFSIFSREELQKKYGSLLKQTTIPITILSEGASL